MYENNNIGKVNRLFELIDNLKDGYIDDANTLRDQLETANSKLKETGLSHMDGRDREGRGVRSSSHQLAKKTAIHTLTDDSKNKSSSIIGYKPAEFGVGSDESGKKLLNNLHSVISSVEKYREVCPAETAEARLIFRKLNAELEQTMESAREITESVEKIPYTQSRMTRTEQREGIRSMSPQIKSDESSPNMTAANSIIVSLQSLNRKLERKCEDRKQSLKKLYCIVVEKDRQLREACSALEKLKIGSKQLIQRFAINEEEFNTRIEHFESKLSFISNIAKSIFEAFPYLQTDGSLEYSMTRRYEAIQKSILSGNKMEEAALQNRRSYESTGQLQIDVPEPTDHIDPLENLDETTANILQLARERFSFSQEEDPDNPATTLVKIVKDWAYLIDSFADEVSAKQEAIESKTQLLHKLDERERIHAGVMRDLAFMKDEKAKEINDLKTKEEFNKQEIEKLRDENEQMKKDLQATSRSQGLEGLPPLKERTSSRELKRRKKDGGDDVSNALAKQVQSLQNENDKLKDKISIYSIGLEDKLSGVERTLKDISMAKDWVENLKNEFNSDSRILMNAFKESTNKFKLSKSLTCGKLQESIATVVKLQTSMAHLENENRNLKYVINSLEKSLLEHRDTFNLSASVVEPIVIAKDKEIEDSKVKILTLEEEVEKLRKMVTSVDQSMSRGQTFEEVEPRMIDSFSLPRDSHLKSKLTSLEDQLKTCQLELFAKANELEYEKTISSKAEQLKSEMEKVLFETTERLESLKSEAEETRGDLLRMEEQYNNQYTENHEKKEELDEAERTIENITSQNKSLKNDLEDLKVQLAHLSEVDKLAKTLGDQLEAQKSIASILKEELKQSKDNLIRSEQELKIAIKQSDASYSSFKDQYDIDIAKLKQEVQQTEDEKNNLVSEHHKLTCEIRTQIEGWKCKALNLEHQLDLASQAATKNDTDYRQHLEEIELKHTIELKTLKFNLQTAQSKVIDHEQSLKQIQLSQSDSESKLSIKLQILQTRIDDLTEENRAFDDMLNEESSKCVEQERLFKEEINKRELLEKKLESIQAELVAMQAQLNAKIEVIDELENDVCQERLKCENAEEAHLAAIEELQGKIEILEGDIQEKEVQIKHCMENNLEKEELEQENSVVKEERDKLALELQNCQNFTEVLRLEIKKYRLLIQNASNETKKKEAEVDEVRQKAFMEKAELNSSVKTEFEKVTAKIKEKDIDIDNLKEVILTHEKNAECLKSTQAQLAAKIEDNKNTIASKESTIKDQAENFKVQIAERNKEISTLNSNLSSLQKEIATFNKSLSELKSSLEVKEDKIKDLITENTSLKTILTSSEEKIIALKEEIDQLESTANENAETFEAEKAEIESMYGEELQRLAEEVDKFKKDAEHNLKDISNKDKELIRLKQVQDDLQIEIQQKSDQINRLNGELQKKTVDSSGVLKAKDKYVAQLEAKIKCQDEEIEDISNRLISTDKKLQAAEEELETRDGNQEALTQNLDAISAELEEKNSKIKSLETELKQIKKDITNVREELKQEKVTGERNLELSNNKSASIENLKKEIEKRKTDYEIVEENMKKEKDITKAQAQALKDKDSKLREATNRVSQLTEECQQTTKLLVESEKNIHDLKSSVSLAESKISSLNSKIFQLEKESQEERSKVLKQQSAVKEQEEGVEFMRQSLERERVDRQKDKKAYEAELEKAKETLAKESSSKLWIEAEKNKLDEKRRQLENTLLMKTKNINKLESEAKEKDEDIGRMKGDLATLAARGNELEDALDSLKSNHDEQKGAYTEALFEISKLEEDLQQATSRLGEADTLVEQVEVYKKQCEMLNQNLQDRETTLGAWQTKCRDLDLNLERLTSQIVRVKEERNQFDEHIAEYKQRATKAEESMANAITERNIERDERKSIRGLLEQTQKQLEMLEAREKDTERRLKESRDDLKSKESDQESLRVKLKQSQDESTKLMATITGFQSKLVELQKENENKKKKLEELSKELDIFKQKESEQLDKIKSETATLDMNKNVMEGRVKELASSLDTYRARLEVEKENNIRLKIDLEKEEVKTNAAEGNVAKLQEEVKLAKENPRIGFRDVDRNLMWKMLSLKVQVKELKRRYATNLIVARKSKPLVKQAKQLNKDNQKLAEELMSQTRKLILIEKNRSEMEDQLNQKENELDQVIMISRTMKSDTEHNGSAREMTIEGNRITETRAQQMKQVLRDLLFAIKDLLGMPLPPLENLNHKQWDNYAQKFKSKLSEVIIQVNDVEEVTSNYKVLLDQQNQECERLREELRLKQLGKSSLILELGSPHFDKSLSIIEKNDSMNQSKLKAFLNDVNYDNKSRSNYARS